MGSPPQHHSQCRKADLELIVEKLELLTRTEVNLRKKHARGAERGVRGGADEKERALQRETERQRQRREVRQGKREGRKEIQSWRRERERERIPPGVKQEKSRTRSLGQAREMRCIG